MSLEGHLETALSYILLAGFLDAMDGKLARYLNAASLFGAEIDTLADFFNFGIATGFLLYHTLYLGTAFASIGWMAVLVLAICCALRLARFNLSIKPATRRVASPDYFIGVPAPALACLALMPIFIHLWGWEIANFSQMSAGYIVLLGLLSVSTVPTFSVKHAKSSHAQLPYAMAAVIILNLGLLNHP
jgi:CDP-diacylglycerol--serine O-phosphatidyltransferase